MYKIVGWGCGSGSSDRALCSLGKCFEFKLVLPKRKVRCWPKVLIEKASLPSLSLDSKGVKLELVPKLNKEFPED
jgi:hypothetical protein